ncbi:MAG: YpdA family putative bacillithiol disulfide reductase [Bacteroidia bacterium]
MNTFDVVIIGAGPIGLSCGIEAQRRGLRCCILEKGCLVNSIYHYPANMTFFSTSDKIEIGGVPFVSHGPKPTRREALEYYRRVKELWQLPVRTYERVSAVAPMPDGYEVVSGKGRYHTRSVVIATGFFDHPNRMEVPGEDLPKVRHYYDEPHPYIDQRVLVVGAANSAVDAALETWRKGAEVTLVVRQAEISPRVKYWVKPDIDNRIAEGSIKAYFNSRVLAIHPDKVDILTPDGPLSIGNDWVLAMTGFKPDYSWLEHLGVCVSDDALRLPQRDETTFETNLPNVYLAGTVCGGMNTNKWFIENSVVHAAVVMDEIDRRRSLRVGS